MKKLVLAIAIFVSALTFIKPVQARTETQTVKYAINLYWCGKIKKTCTAGKKALSVAWCESRFNMWARNGQYLGIFQMGTLERRIYGHAWNIWIQVKAAHKYYKDAGWRPWACA